MEEAEFYVSEDTTYLDIMIQEYVMAGYIPHWHACVEGPGDIYVEMEGLLVKTRDEAEELVWEHIAHLCMYTAMPFVPTEWTLLHLHGVGGN